MKNENPQDFNLEMNGRTHRVTLTPMPKGRIMKVHTPDGKAYAATAVRPAEEPAQAARWMLNHHKLFKDRR